ncbi:MAG: beta strand repeat-containing protein, partial [Phascolarctobacterium sp.]
TFSSADKAAQAIKDNSWSLDKTASVDIHGQINTATGIDLRAAYINVTKTGDTAPLLQTGAMFNTIVNNGKVEKASVAEGRLTASLDDKGNIVIADPNAPGSAELKGDGSIKLTAYSDSKNTNTEFLGITSINNTVEAKVEVGEGATIDARGNVEISAEAKRLQRTKITEFWDMVAFTKADTTVNGTVSGADVKVAAIASSEYSGGNYANVLDILNDGLQESEVIGIKSKFSSYFLGLMESSSHWGTGGMLTNNILNQLYMPFAITDAKATTSIGSKAQITAKILKNGNVAPTYTKDQEAYTAGGNLSVTANSKAKNKMKVGIQPHIEEGKADLSKYFTGGFIVQDSTSHATVNVDGKLQSEKNMEIAATAKNTNSGSMDILTPKFYDKGQHGDKYASMFMVGVGVSFQDTEATVNLGSAALADKGSQNAPLLNAGGKLDVKATSTNEMESEVSVGSDLAAGDETDDTAVSTAVNFVDSEGTATINDYVAVKGDSVDMEATHTLDSLSISTCDEYVGEFTGLYWVINNEKVAEKADALKPFLASIGLGNQMPDNPGAAGGGGGGGAAGGGANVTDWNQYFDLGASVAVAEVTNNAKLNVYPVAFAEATDGDLNLNAAVEIGDTSFSTTNLLMNSNDTTYITAAAAVGIEYMENTAEVNINQKEANSQESKNVRLRAAGDVSITSDVEQRYNRVDSMCDDLLDAWESFKKHYTDWSKPGVKDKFDKLQSIIIDILWIRDKEKTASYKDSKKFGKKASAAIDLLTSLTGTGPLKDALLAFVEPSNYVNMYVSAGAKNNDGDKQQDVAAVLTGTVGVQNLHNTANVNIGANAVITAGDSNGANIAANVVESNVLAAGKLSAFPYIIIDPTPLADAQNGIGGTVGVQNAYNNSKVKIMNGVTIEAGSIDIATKNDVLNIGIGIAGSQTSKLGVTGMVSYLGGESHAETLVDDDVEFTARKKVEKVAKKKDDGTTEYKDEVTSTGAVNISSTNATNVINLVGDWNSSEVSSVGASVGVISYDIHSIAELTNQEVKADGTSAETSATANHKGNISANSVNINALTDGTINTFTVAGVKNSSENDNQQASGANAAAGGGAGAVAGGVQNAQINGGNAGGQDATIKLNAVGSVSWNYVVDETKASLDNVSINLTKAEVADNVTDATLKNDKSASVKVEAEDASYIGAYSGAMALNKLGNGDNSKFQGTLAGAVGVNDLKKTTTATLKNTDINRSTADVGVDVLNYAHNSGAQVATGLSLGLETGKREGGVAINLAASGSANYIDSTVHADMLNDAIVGGNTVVDNVAYDQDVQVAGGVTTQVTKSTASAGAAVTVNDIKNDIKALMNNNTIGAATVKAAEVHNIAASKLTQVGTAISVGVATGDKSYAVLNVAVAKNNVNNTVNASIDGGSIYANKLSGEAKDGKLSVDTADNKYLTELNQTNSFAVSVDAEGNFVTGEGNQQHTLARDITLDQDGNYYKNGQLLTPAVEIKDDGYYQGNDKLQANITKDAAGNYCDINGEPITLDEKDGLYHDINGNIVDVEDVRYFNPTTHEEVDVANVVYTDPSGKIVDIYDVQYKDGSDNVINPNELKVTTKNFYDFTGTDALNEANGSQGAEGFYSDITIGENAEGATYTKSKIELSNQGNTIVGVALGLGVVTGEGGKVSGAAATAANVNTITNNFTAAVKNATIGTVSSSYETSGELKEAAMRVEAASDTSMVSVAAGAAADAKRQGVSIAVAGSGAFQSITNTTNASVENSTVATDNLAIKSTTESSLVSVAGQVSVETSQKGVAAGLTWAENNMNNTTSAYAKGITLNSIDTKGANLNLLAENKATTWAVAVGASVSLGNGAAEGAYAENSGKNNTEAIVDQYGTRKNTINNAKNISVTAKDTSVEKGIAGSIAVAAGENAMASLGGAVVYNNIGNGAAANQKQTVKAQLNNAVITTMNGATIQTKATNEADFLGLALGGAVRAGNEKLGVSAEGSVAVTTDYMNTIAGMDNVNIDQSSGSQNSKVEVEAKSTSDITSSADALSVSVGDGIKISGNAAVSKVRSDADTTTEIKNSIIKAQDVIAKANSTNEILDVAIGLSAAVGGGSASVALAGNVATNRIDNDTTVTFANDDIYATGTVAALSDSYERLRNYGGGISVGVSSQAGVALGATVVTNTIEGDTESVVNNSSIIALGAGDGVKVNKYSFDAISGSSSKYELKETAAQNTTAKKGLVVNAEAEHLLRDVSITGGVAVGGEAGVAVDATVVINKISGNTSAKVDNTDVNKNISPLSTADVTVDAYDRADISSHIGTMSVGVGAGEGAGVGAAGAGDRNTVDRTTIARILGKADGSTVLNGHKVNVDALGYTSVYLSESGLAAGASALAGAGVTGSVSVDRFTSNTTALVSQVKGTVNDLIVNANRLANVEAYNNAIALSGGIFSGSVSVGVTDVEDTSHTNAELSKVQFAAANDQSGNVRVLAENHTQLGTELSGDALAISIGGAAGIAVGNINTEAQVGAKVDHAVIGTEAKEFGEFTVDANNYTYNRYQNIAVGAGSLLGVAVGKGAMNINTGTAAEVLNSSTFAKNININAFERRTIDTDMVGVGVGALVVGVNVMYTNIGTNMQSKYTYDDGSKEYDNSDFSTMVNNALARMNSQVDVVRAKTGDSSIEYSSSTINTGRADQGGIRNTISNSVLKASEDLKVQAKATTNTDIDIKQASIAIVNIGVPANRTDVEDKLTVDIDNAALQGKAITVESVTDGDIKSYTGQGGFSGASYVDTTAYVKHHGTNKITIDGSTLNVVNAASATINPLWVRAVNRTQIDNSALGLNIGGLVAGRVVLEGEDSTEVKVELGKDENVNTENVFSSTKLVDDKVVYAGVKAVAENAAVVKDEIKAHVGVSGVAVGGSIVTSKATGKATLAASSKNAFAAGAVTLESETGGTKNQYTTEAINRAVGVSALTINVDKARTYNNMQATTTVDAIRIIDQVGEDKITPADLKIGATNATTSNAYIHSVNVGIGAASGSNFAQSHAEGKAITTVNAGAGGISANSFDIFASNSDDIIAKADGSNAGLMNISPYAARVENTVDTTTTVNLTGKFAATGAFKAQALRKDVENFAADALSVTVAGGGDARADSTITANTNLNATNATITSGGDMLLEAENTVEMNRKDGYAQMVKGQGFAVFGVNTSGIGNTINSTTHVNLLNSQLTSAGNLKAIAHTEEQLQVNGYVYTASALGGVETRVTNNITNDELVKVENTSLDTNKAYKDITLSAADDLKLFTYAYSEFSSGAMGGANAILNNNLTRNNKINITSGSNLYSLQDINLYAGKNADGSVATLDLDAEATDFVGSVIPIPIRPTVNNDIKQNNQITVDARSASTSVRHSNLYASQGREMARVYANSYVGIYGSSQKGSFVTTDKGETIDGKTANNYVDINGNVVAGIANKVDITIGSDGDIVILDEALRNSVSGAKDTSQITITVDANGSTGLTRDSLTFGSENYANTLYERYNAVLDLMNEYEKDGNNSAVYLGYQAEANRILEEMLTLGLAEKVPVKGSDPQNPTYVLEPKASLLVDYVEIPELVGSGGNIIVDTDVFKSSGGTGVTKAQGTPVINITNNTNLMTKVNSIIVGDPGGKLVYNGQNVGGADTAGFNQSIKALNKGSAGAGFKTIEAADGESGVINIHGKYNGNTLNYTFTDETGTHTGSYRPMANIQIQGNIYSKEGTVTIKSDNDSILMQGKDVKDAVSVSGSTINIIAENGNITQGYTDGIVNIGADVRQQYDAQYQQIIKKSDGTYTLSYVETPIADNSKGSGSYIAGGSVYINASDININGVIQSGFGDYYADISDATTQARIIQINNAYTGMAISDSVVTTGEQYKIIDGGAYWSAADGCYKYRLNVYYNPSTKKILVQNVDASGGKIYLTGRISSTGNGKIVCLDGVSNINVNNTTSYDLQVGDLITHDVAGLVSITDTAKGKLTEITNGKVTVKDILAGGKISATGTSSDFTGSYNYAPQTGLRYTWTTGKEVTTFNRYSKDFKEGGWGMWDNGVDTETLANWTTTNNVQPIETGLTNNKDRAPGETIRLDTTAANNSFVTVTHKKVTDKTVKESERKFSTGLWGINKHYVVTWTRTTGDLYTYDASVKADNPINIKFVGNNADSGNVNVTSINNIELTGTVGNTALYETKVNDVVTGRNEKGTVNITTQNGSLIQSGGALYGADINLSAAKDMTDITVVAGDTVNLSAVNNMSNQDAIAQNSIDITVKGAYLAKGNVVLGNLGSVVTNNNVNSVPVNASGVKTTGVTGLVEITTTGSEGNISQKAGSLIVSDRIDLTSNNGSIYGQKSEDATHSVTSSALQLYAGQQPIGLDTLDASINASAKGDINLEQVDGNMRIGRIYATEGDVTLTVAHGSVEDALPYVSSDRGDADDMVARWKRLGIVDAEGSDADMLEAKNFQNQSAELDTYEAWDTYALLYAIQDSIVNPEASALPSTSDKDPNVIGHNITINVADSVGMNNGIEQRIDTTTLLDKDASGYYKNLDDLKALSKLDASTKVTWETGENGHTYAVYTETIPIGIQQTTKIVTTEQETNVVNGKLTIQSAATSAASGNALHGDIFLQGREQKLANGEGITITQNKDLFVNNIMTKVGEVTLTSLGGIYNAASNNLPAITGQNLMITAAGGSIGTVGKHLTTSLLGEDKTTDGLSAIATGGIYVDQKGANALMVRNISSGGDIYLGSDQNIVMGVVNGTDAVNYIRAENNGDITLEARGGSIGEAAYETDENGNVELDEQGNPIISCYKNNGVRILNSAKASSSNDEANVSNVTLRARDNVYVTGVASVNGSTAAAQGPAGTLNLTVQGKNAAGEAVTLQNVGIYVDGALNLEAPLVASETASAYVTGDLLLDNNIDISSADTYIGSGKNLTINGAQNVVGTDKLTME